MPLIKKTKRHCETVFAGRKEKKKKHAQNENVNWLMFQIAYHFVQECLPN